MNSKKCNKCKKVKKIALFSLKNKKTGQVRSMCKECHSQYRHQHYLKNRKKYIDKAKRWNGQQKEKLIRFVAAYLSGKCCADCGETDMVVLDFDHKRDKFMGISNMVRNCYSIEAISKEIKKCEIRCANCHRRRTSKEKGYWKANLGP